jgi:hypothetical protein
LLNVTSHTDVSDGTSAASAAGYAALAAGDFRVEPEHPPLIRLWAALPVIPRSAALANGQRQPRRDG